MRLDRIVYVRLIPVLVCIFLAAAARANEAHPVRTWPKSAHQILNSMTVEQKVGQLLFFGFPGTTLEPRLSALIKKYQPGGLIVFSHNIQSARQIAHLNYQAQKLSSTPLFIAVDQEGGDVSRIKTYPPFPSALAIGNTQSEELALTAGQEAGRLLRSLGFNMNLAPVVDVVRPEKPSFLGTRVFGHDPKLVSKLTLSFGQGLLQAGVLPTLKHFPGHGNATVDSHRFQTVIPSDKAELFSTDLMPFHYLIRNLPTPPAVMVAHVSYPSLDASKMPATYSQQILDHLLRDKMRFQGLSLTDDLEMSGADLPMSMSERAVRAFLAGNDLVMVVWTPEVKAQVYQGLLDAVHSGRIPQERLEESVLRIISTKLKLGYFQPLEEPNDEQIKSLLNSPKIRMLSAAVVVSSLKRSLPQETLARLQESKGPLMVIAGHKSIYDGVKKFNPGREVSHQSFADWTPTRLSQWLSRNDQAWAIVHITGNQSGKWLSSARAEVRDRILVINSGPARLIAQPEKYLAVVELHSQQPEVGQILGQLLLPTHRAPSSHTQEEM